MPAGTPSNSSHWGTVLNLGWYNLLRQTPSPPLVVLAPQNDKVEGPQVILEPIHGRHVRGPAQGMYMYRRIGAVSENERSGRWAFWSLFGDGVRVGSAEV